MSMISQSQAQIATIYDKCLKTALMKNKCIEKRIKKRAQTIKWKFTQLKNLSRQIRLQQKICQKIPSQISKQMTQNIINQKILNQSNFYDQIQPSISKKDQIQIDKTHSQKTQRNLQFNQPTHQNHDKNQPRLDKNLYSHNQVFDKKKDSYQGKNQENGFQRSDYQTPKFNSSDKDSSFFSKTLGKQQSQSLMFSMSQYEENQKNTTLQKKQVNKQNLIDEKQSISQQYCTNKIETLFVNGGNNSIHQQTMNQCKFDTFSNIPEKQTNTINNQQQNQELDNKINSLNQNQRNQNALITSNKIQQMNIIQINSTQENYSLGKECLKIENNNESINQYDLNHQPSIFFHPFQQFQPLNIQQIQFRPPNQISDKVNISKLQINHKFLYKTGKNVKLAKNKKRLFIQKKKRRNSSDNRQDD